MCRQPYDSANDSDNGLLLVRRLTITWTNADILPVWPSAINFSEILNKMQELLFNEIHLKCPFTKWLAGLKMSDFAAKSSFSLSLSIILFHFLLTSLCVELYWYTSLFSPHMRLCWHPAISQINEFVIMLVKQCLGFRVMSYWCWWQNWCYNFCWRCGPRGRCVE